MITEEITATFQHKNLHLLSRNSTDLGLKTNYKSYCKSLTKAIIKDKKNLVQ